MSFKCDVCSVAQPNGVRTIKVVTETRPKQYISRYKKIDDEGEERWCEKLSEGFETVSEQKVCAKCSARNIEVDESALYAQEVKNAVLNALRMHPQK